MKSGDCGDVFLFRHLQGEFRHIVGRMDVHDVEILRHDLPLEFFIQIRETVIIVEHGHMNAFAPRDLIGLFIDVILAVFRNSHREFGFIVEI